MSRLIWGGLQREWRWEKPLRAQAVGDRVMVEETDERDTSESRTPGWPACLILMESDPSPLGVQLETIPRGVIVKYGRDTAFG